MTWYPFALAAFGVSLLLTPLIARAGRELGWLDVPNQRSSHSVPTPRVGGVSVAIAVAVSGLLITGSDRALAACLLGAAVVSVTGLADDAREIPAGLRLAIQLLAASLVVRIAFGSAMLRIWASSDVLVIPGVAAGVFAVVWIVSLTNAFNFMDGMNGMAGFHAVLASGTLSVLAMRHGDPSMAMWAACVVGAAAGFLPWNVPVARVFLGDAGSCGLGFLLSAFAMREAMRTGFVPVVLIFAPFLLDTGATLVARATRGETLWIAHRSHFYQRLNALGWSHLSVSLLWALMSAGGCAVALGWGSMNRAGQAATVFALLIVHVAVAISITARESRRLQR